MKKLAILPILFLAYSTYSQNGGDTCSTAVQVFPGSYSNTTISGGSNGAEMSGGASSSWFYYDATEDGVISIRSCVGDSQWYYQLEDTDLYVGTGSCGSLTSLPLRDVQGTWDDFDVVQGEYCSVASNIPVATGTRYYIEWADTYNPGSFDWELSFAPCRPISYSASVMDDCLNDQFTISINVSDLGTASNYTIANSYNANVTNINSTGNYVVGPFPDIVLVTLDFVHDSNFNCDISDTPYFSGCVPSNDDFANAIAVTEGTYYGNTTNATIDEATAPIYLPEDLIIDAPNTWYTYTGSGNAESVTVSLCGSYYDTSLIVYTGTSGNLTPVYGNDDFCGLQSQITFTSDGITTYYFTVEGFDVDSFGIYSFYFGTATLGLEEELDQLTFKLSPNPVNTRLNFILPGSYSNMQYEIFDIMGKRIDNASFINSRHSIDVNALSKGIYLFKIISDERVFLKRFIKN
ncbi:T9SS type A sorting domain-containing protein [Aestuariivivens sediminicola]|uniref:T9SS type A sorting domain-containing protein n=1 Tax=Aestuariivivens sediminicola TaxID=2913560 RepID=UPI001F56D7CB|nr:T9SS type A sorting domain-containing protein [Aestuariivivens sediminicola]